MSPFETRFSQFRARLAKFAFVPVVVYCAILARPALRAQFSNDDPMNMGWAWRDGFANLLWHAVTFWSTNYRPVGQLFYLSIYRTFGLNPRPYRIAILCFVVANAYLSYRLAQSITGSRTVALVTGMFAGAHASMVDMYYQNDIIYDVLAYFFSMLTMICYVGARKQGELPSLRRTLLILGLFIIALDCKEISVTVAGFILAYEVLFKGMPTWSGSMTWAKREGRLPLLLMLLTAIYTAGKVLGAQSLTDDPGYKLEISVGKYIASGIHHWNDLFYMLHLPGQTTFMAIQAALLMVLLFFKKSPTIRWCCFYVLTATLPLAFIPQRGGTELYLALFGWALLVSTVSVKLIEFIAPALVWPRFQIPPAAIRMVLVALLIYSYVSETVQTWKGQPYGVFLDQAETWSAFSQLKKLPFRPEPGSSVLFLDDPFRDYRLLFIAQLVWDDPSVNIDVAARRPVPPTPEEIAQFKSLLTIESGEVKVIRDH